MSANVCTSGELRFVGVEEIEPSRTNPRREFEGAALAELAESIRQVGILQPLVVRRADAGRWELVAGERRWRAAKLASVVQVPVIVRELTDLQALEVQVLENLQRQDIRPMEEAEGFRRLIDSGAYTAETLAQRLGKSRSHVFGRLRLLRLVPEVQEAVTAGAIEASVGDLVSKFAPELQAEALKEVLPPKWAGGEALTFRECKRRLAEFWPDLKGAPWHRKDPEDLVPAAGGCASCPKRSGNMPDVGGTLGGEQVCTDRNCYRLKLEAWRAGKVRELEEKGKRCVALAQVDDAFANGDRKEPGYGSGWVALSSRCFEAAAGKRGGEGRSWRELLGEKAKTLSMTAVTAAGTVVEVAQEAEVRDYLVGTGVLVPRSGGTGAGKAERAAVRERNRIERDTLRRMGEACMEAARKMDGDEFLRRFARLVLPGSAEVQTESEPKRGLQVVVIEEFRALCVQALAWSKSQGWQEWRLSGVCEAFGVTREPHEKAARKLEKEGSSARGAEGKARTGRRPKGEGKGGLSSEARARIAAAAKARWARVKAGKEGGAA